MLMPIEQIVEGSGNLPEHMPSSQVGARVQLPIGNISMDPCDLTDTLLDLLFLPQFFSRL